MAQQKKAATDGTAKQSLEQTQEIKGTNIPPSQETCVKTHSMTSQEQIKEAETTYKIEKPRLGRPPASDYIDLDKLTEFASQPIENYKIAEALGLSLTTFYKYMRENTEFKEAYNQGMENRKYELEKALYKRATGFEATEIITEKDNEGNIIKQKITDKSYVPDTAAAIFALKNVYSDKYKERVETVTDININFNQIQALTNEELVKLASNNVQADYTIE